MNTKKLIISTLVIFIPYVLMDFLFYTFVFPEEYMSKVVREEPLMQWVFAGLLIASFLFSYLFGEMAKGRNQGLKYGLILGGFMYLPLFLIFYGTRDTRPLAAWLTNAAFHIVQFGVFGIIAAYIQRTPTANVSDD